MKKRTISIFFLSTTILLLTVILLNAAHDLPAWLTESMGPPDSDAFTIYYATSCPASEPDCTANELVPATDTDDDGFPDLVEEMSGYLDGSRSAFVDTFAMREPQFDGDPIAYMSGGCWGQYNGHRIRMCAQGTALDWVQAKATALHELFHATQWAYDIGQPGWVMEGQAGFMEDQVFADLDADPGTFLYSQGNVYLSDPDRRAITGTSYPAAWFWKYFAEQYGTSPNPGQGMDAIKTFWDRGRSESASGIAAVNEALAILSPGTTFEDVYKDFVIANYARKLSGPTVPAKYYFADEAEPNPGPLQAVKLDVDQPLAADEQVGPLITSVRAWGVRYYEVRPAADVPVISINVRQDTSSRVFYALLGIRGNDLVLEERVVGRHFNRALPNDSYDRMILVVAGLENYANFRFNINGRSPILNIVDPLQVRPAQAGDPADPDKILVKVEILDAIGEPVTGIDPTTFIITIGSEVVPVADILIDAYVQGQYWLLIKAPDQTSGGLHDLNVGWTSLSDRENLAVDYTVRPDGDHVLVIDRSFSMNDFNKMAGAKNAGRLYVDSWRNGEQIGVVSFNQDATVNMALQTLTDPGRLTAKSAINGLAPSGATSIGDGAIAALDEMVARGDLANVWAMVVLSDGRENRDERISDFMAIYKARRRAGEKLPEVHTVALGADADRGQLQDLADWTGGTYQYAAEPTAAPISAAAGESAQTAAATAGDFELELAEIYRVVGEAVNNQQQIFSKRINIQATAVINIPVDALSREALFTLNWQSILTGATAHLYRPDGTEVSDRLSDTSHFFWREKDPQPGVWRLTLSCIGVEFCAQTYLVEAAVKNPVTFDVYLTPGAAERSHGLPVTILAALTDEAPILGAAINARITAPAGGIYNLPLYDDGLHQDGKADDGLYGNRFFQTFEPGTYVVKTSAAGRSNFGTEFARLLTRAFDVAASNNSDQDGLPDSWEKENGTDPFLADGDQDPDLDGLSNQDEYFLGTDPQDPDTDDGGESDGSEAATQKDPLDPQDDNSLNFTGELYVTPGNGFNLVEFPVQPGYKHLWLYRATDPAQAYALINQAVPPTGSYIDQNLTNNTTYWYRLVAVGSDGQRSWPADAVAGKPKSDPTLPGGWVLINDGAEETDSLQVMLTLGGSDDAESHTPDAHAEDEHSHDAGPPAEMRISNDPNLDGAEWVPFKEQQPWTLDTISGPAVVYVEFRDAAANVSLPISDAIIVRAGSQIYLPIIMHGAP